MHIEATTYQALVSHAASYVERLARESIEGRGSFACALSGGSTPWKMLTELAQRDLEWERIHFFQVDERVAPEGHTDRNATQLKASLGAAAARARLHLMAVAATDVDRAADEYADELRTICGSPAVLDLVHLGIGEDGHTASLVPGDPVLAVRDRDVALTAPYQGRVRMTLTYPVLDRARSILWLASGAAKQRVLSQLLARDGSIPAGVVSQSNAVLITDVSL